MLEPDLTSAPTPRQAVPELSDGSVALRAWRETDAADVLAACQDPDIQHWLPVPVPYLEEHALGFVTDFASEQWRSGRGAPFAVVDGSTGRLLASVALKDIDPVGGVAEVGYWVAPWARERGVARRAVGLLRDWAFGALGLRRLELLIEPTNGASRRVAEALGAVQEELLLASEVIQGVSRDLARFVLTPAEVRE